MPTRGSPAASSCASGCLASQSSSAETSRPSSSGESTVDRPAGLAEPARVPGQHVEAGLAQRPDADVAGRLASGCPRPSSREPPQPWVSRIVGAFWPGFSPAAGWKEATICVPSKEVTIASRAWAAGGEDERRAHGRRDEEVSA